MAVLYLTEFAGQDPNYALVGQMPGVTTQTVAIGAGSTQSAAFNANTSLILIDADSVCSIAVGANPTATATTMRIPANQLTYFWVHPGHKIAVIQNT